MHAAVELDAVVVCVDAEVAVDVGVAVEPAALAEIVAPLDRVVPAVQVGPDDVVPAQHGGVRDAIHEDALRAGRMGVVPAVRPAARIVYVAPLDRDLRAAGIDHDAGGPVDRALLALGVDVTGLAARTCGEQRIAGLSETVQFAVAHANSRRLADEHRVVPVSAAALDHHVVEQDVPGVHDPEHAAHQVFAAEHNARLGRVADPSIRRAAVTDLDRIPGRRGVDHDRLRDGHVRLPRAERPGRQRLAGGHKPHLVGRVLRETEDRAAVVGRVEEVGRRLALFPFAAYDAVLQREAVDRSGGSPADRAAGIRGREPQFTCLHRLDERHALRGRGRGMILLPAVEREILRRALKCRVCGAAEAGRRQSKTA